MMPYTYRALSKIDTVFQIAPHTQMVFPRYQNLLLACGHDDRVLVMEAYHDQRLIGVGMAYILQPLRLAEILSIYVTPQYRNQGIGTHLMRLLEEALRERSIPEVTLSYQTGQPTTAAWERMLQRNGWSEPETTLFVCLATCEKVTEAPWMHQRTVPDGFLVFPWCELSETDKEVIREKKRLQDWYPDMVSPFIDKTSIEPMSSIGVRHEDCGEIAGWMITHQISPKILRYTSHFVSPPYRHNHLGRFLIIEAIWRTVEHKVAEQGLWHFRPDNKATIHFTTEIIRDYLDAFNQIRHSRKMLVSVDAN